MSENPSTSEFNADSFDLPDIFVPPQRGNKRSSNREVSKNKLPEKCLICRHPAVGHHYDVASCNGCKAFFRRTIITGRRFKCSNDQKCFEGVGPVESASGHRVCGFCRFAKCVKMGMNPKAVSFDIVSGKGKLLVEDVIEQQKSGRNLSLISIGIEDELSRMISQLTTAETQLEKLQGSTLPESMWDSRTLSEILTFLPNFEISRVPLERKEEQLFPVHGIMTHATYLAIVEHMKLMEYFPKISLNSAEKLLMEGVIINCNMVNCFTSIRNFNADNVRRQDGTTAGKPMRNYDGIWADHRTIIQKTLHSFLRVRMDYTEYMFLKVIAMCNPTTDGLSMEDQKVIEKERQRFARNLLEYCLRKLGKAQGPDRFAAILSVISILENQKREQKSFMVILQRFYSHVPILVSPLYDGIMGAP